MKAVSPWAGAVDHAFADELGAGRGHDADGLGQDLGDFAGAVRAGAEFGHVARR